MNVGIYVSFNTVNGKGCCNADVANRATSEYDTSAFQYRKR